MKQQSAVLVSTGDLAKMLGLTPRRVQQLVSAGTIPPPIQNRHDLAQAVPAYLDFLRRSMQSKGLTGERERLTKLKADLLELENQRRRGELIEVSACQAQFADVATAIRSSLLGLPSKLGARLVGLRKPGEAATVVKEAVYEVLTELSRLSPEDVEKLAQRSRQQKAS